MNKQNEKVQQVSSVVSKIGLSPKLTQFSGMVAVDFDYQNSKRNVRSSVMISADGVTEFVLRLPSVKIENVDATRLFNSLYTVVQKSHADKSKFTVTLHPRETLAKEELEVDNWYYPHIVADEKLDAEDACSVIKRSEEFIDSRI